MVQSSLIFFERYAKLPLMGVIFHIFLSKGGIIASLLLRPEPWPVPLV